MYSPVWLLQTPKGRESKTAFPWDVTGAVWEAGPLRERTLSRSFHRPAGALSESSGRNSPAAEERRRTGALRAACQLSPPSAPTSPSG